MGFFSERAEASRQGHADDRKFFRSMLYFFELSVPSKSTSTDGGSETTSLLFPLIMNPTVYEETDNFTLVATPGVDAGLTLEENGVISRLLHIEGTTGWKPKSLGTVPALKYVVLENQSFQPRGKPEFVGALSGQRHFQFLQDQVFRTYGDLKRDPSTAAGTSMSFHSLKDDVHWKVAPQRFTMRRSASKPLAYDYIIDLLIYDKASRSEGPELISEDAGIIGAIKDGVATVRGAYNDVVGAVKDVQNVINDIENFVSGVSSLLGDIIGFVNVLGDFVSGVADLIAAPFGLVGNLLTDIDSMLTQMDAIPFQARDTVMNSFRRMGDSFDTLRMHPELFADDPKNKLRSARAQQELTTSRSASSLSAAASNPPKTLKALSKKGTGLLAGDKDRARGERGLGRGEPGFASVIEHQLTGTDSLPSLAAKYLSDARKWRQIAEINQLKPPYISAQGLPGTLPFHGTILIPSDLPAPEVVRGASILGVRSTEPLADRLLGKDLKLVPAASDPRFLDIEVDAAHDRTDASTVSGVENLAQALRFRMDTEQGQDILFKTIGRKRLIGVGIGEIDAEIVSLRLSEALLADSRIQSIRRIELSNTDAADTIVADADAVVKGFSAPIKVTATLPR